MHQTTVSIPVAGQAVSHHVAHEDDDRHSWSVGSPIAAPYAPTYLGGSVTELVEFGERCILAAISHAAESDIDPVYLWRDYLRVVLDRAERNCALHARRTDEPLPLEQSA